MALLAADPLFGHVIEYDHLRTLVLSLDGRLHLGALDHWLADDCLLTVVDQQNLVEGDLLADFASQLLDFQPVARSNPILLTTCLDYCVHRSLLPGIAAARAALQERPRSGLSGRAFTRT